MPDQSVSYGGGMSSASDLRTIALTEFAAAGYAGTSIARIAELAGLSKSSVLYHYASKEALLEAALAPAIERLGAILTPLAPHPLQPTLLPSFIEEFVDFLLDHRLEVHTFINQGASLAEVPVIARAAAQIVTLGEYFSATLADTEQKMRFGIALGGAAYTLCTEGMLGEAVAPRDETRAALITIMTELLTPVTGTLTLSE